MNIERFREIIRQREHISKISQDEWDDGIEECWKNEIAVLSEDVMGTVAFLKNECTASEYSWISEVITDLAEQTQNSELVEAFKALARKFPEEAKEYYIANDIQDAEKAIINGRMHKTKSAMDIREC